MTFRERLLDLENQRTALAQAIATFESERQQALANLPASFGYGNLDSFIKALKDAAQPAPKQRKPYSRNVTRPGRPRKVKTEAVQAEVKVAESVVIEPSPAAAVAIDAPVSVSAPAPVPVGSDLGDPANFGLLPDRTLLDPASAALENVDYVETVSQAIAFARQVMATSKVPPAVWRDWRDFEKQASDVLRGRNRQVFPDSE